MKFKNNTVSTGETTFTRSAVPDLQFSRFRNNFKHITTFNAGDIVPIYCGEILPHDVFQIDLDFVCRQNTALVPTMGTMYMDIYAFFVPNRIVNESWKNVQGENSSGKWVAPEVSLAPLLRSSYNVAYVKVPVGSVADYYGFPTQDNIPRQVLMQCHDLKFRGYLEVYNKYFRSQNYEPAIAYSKLNVYQGFFENVGTYINALGTTATTTVALPSSTNSSGSYGASAIVQSLYGEGGSSRTIQGQIPAHATVFSALGKPLKANKLHDMFTSVLPSPQKGIEVGVGLTGTTPVRAGATMSSLGNVLKLTNNTNPVSADAYRLLGVNGDDTAALSAGEALLYPDGNDIIDPYAPLYGINESNMYVDLAAAGINITDLRMSVALQQYQEILARSGSRYREFISAFFGLDTVDNFPDDPQLLGHIRRKLDLYQVAQTSASVSGETPQGNLSAFGYTDASGHLIKKTFLEHGYVHVFAVVRHKNLYSTYLARDNFRMSALDFYQPTLANISEQPIYTREFCPFSPAAETGGVFGYNEAWIEYRYEPDRVSGYMRPGVEGSLAVWNFADDFDDRDYADNEFMKSNSEDMLNRTLAVTSAVAPQFNCVFEFNIIKERAMPVYSIPGLDIL